MANRNTAIRGIQIKDNDVDTAQLSVGVNASLVLADSAYQLPVGGIPYADLAEGVQDSLDLADTALQSLAFTALTDTAGAYSGHAGEALRVNVGMSALEYYVITDNTGVLESAVAVEVPVVSAKVEYTMTTLAVVNSVEVYLNGLLQEEGSGKDYVATEAGGFTVITFAEATAVGDIVVIHSITKA
jgi:hypothetical protein